MGTKAAPEPATSADTDVIYAAVNTGWNRTNSPAATIRYVNVTSRSSPSCLSRTWRALSTEILR